MPAPLTDSEKAYFDTIKQVAGGTRPADLKLFRMTLDGEDVAVVVQRVIDKDTAETVGFQPLAIICDHETIERLRSADGSEPTSVDPRDVEGAG